MDKELKKALMELTEGADPGRVEEAVRERICGETECTGISRRHTGGYRYPVRVVLAAVLVFVLAGSVYAAVQVQKRLTVTLPEDGPYDIVVQVSENADTAAENADGIIGMIEEKRKEFEDAVRKDPMVTLPEEKRRELQTYARTKEDLRNGVGMEKGKQFAAWAEAAEWLNCGLLTSDLPLEQEGVNMRVTGVLYPELGTEANISLSGSVGRPVLEETEIRDDGFLMVTIPLVGDWESYGYVYMADLSYDDEGEHAVRTDEHEIVSTDRQLLQYTTTSGISVEAVLLTIPYSWDVTQNGEYMKTETWEHTELHIYFLQEGILYYFIYNLPNPECAQEVVQSVAESMK